MKNLLNKLSNDFWMLIIEWRFDIFNKWVNELYIFLTSGALFPSKLLGRNLKCNLDAKQGAKGEMEWGPTMIFFLSPSPRGNPSRNYLYKRIQIQNNCNKTFKLSNIRQIKLPKPIYWQARKNTWNLNVFGKLMICRMQISLRILMCKLPKVCRLKSVEAQPYLTWPKYVDSRQFLDN